MKKLINFAVCVFWVLGTIGGVGYAIYGGSWPIAVAIIILALMAWPEFAAAYKELAD